MDENIDVDATVDGVDPKAGWGKRRKVMYIILIAVAAYIGYVLTLTEEPSEVISTVTSGSISICTWMVLGWIFGSVAEDHFKKQTINGIPLKEAWVKRRRVIYLILGYSGAVIAYLTFFYNLPVKTDTPIEAAARAAVDLTIHNEIVKDIIELDTWILLGWMFGSVMDDNWIKLKLKGKLGGKII